MQTGNTCACPAGTHTHRHTPPPPLPSADTCDIRIKGGRPNGSSRNNGNGGGKREKISAIPLNEVLLFTRSGRRLENTTVQAAMVTVRGAGKNSSRWNVLAGACFDGNNNTGCFDPTMSGTDSDNMTLVAKIPCSGSGLDELDKLVLVNTK